MQTGREPRHEALRWDDLRVFLALHRLGSLKRGAGALGVNISTMSRRLDALEAAAGVHLFDRTPDGTRPTVAAERLLPFAEMMEQAADGFARGIESLEVEPEGEVRITAPPGLVDHFLSPALVELCDAYPKLRVSILASIGYADLTRREADLALRLVRPAAGDFVVKRVSLESSILLASSRLAARIEPLRDVEAVRWVTWGDDLAHLPDRRWIDTHVPRHRVVLVTSSMNAQVEAVRGGLGVMLAPRPYRRLRGLAEVRCTAALRKRIAELPEVPLWLVGHRALRDVPRIAAVWSWLEARFAAA